jgi:serine/threonine protein kinase
MDLNPGAMLQDRYRIDGTIGKGGMGAVYKGFDNSLSIPVAIKENLNPLPQAVRQFKREAVLLASLRHPNLPRVTDHFVVGDMQYLIMDYIEGDDLKKILERDGAQPESRVAKWLHEIAGALMYLHGQNPPVVHRDIKPANIKITPDGKPVLVDFGIAKIAESGNVTSTGARSLTPGFAPPEQYGSSQTDARSDQYSLAATTYMLLTGQIPPDSIERTLGQTALTPPRELNPKISPWLDRALIKAMALSSADRFGSIQEFLDAAEGRTPESTIALPPPEPKTVMRTRIAPSGVSTPPAAPASASRGWIGWAAAGLVACVGLGAITGGVIAASQLGFFASIGSSPTRGVAVALTPQMPLAQATLQPSIEVTQTPMQTREKIVANTSAPTQTLTRAPLPTGVGGGRLVAFTSNRGTDRRYQIYTLDISTGEVKQITHDSVDAGRSAWSADGQGLFYESQSNHGHWNILYINLSQSNAQPINVTNDPADDTHPDDLHPTISPRDGKLAFISTRNTGTQTLWWVMLDRTGLENLSKKQSGSKCRQPSEWDPAWSPDGSFLYIAAAFTGPTRIYRWNTYSECPDLVTHLDYGGEYKDDQPAISPDGLQLAYRRFYGSQSDICISAIDISNPALCVAPLGKKGSFSDPAWSPDGLLIAYVSRETGNSEIRLMTIGGGDRGILASSPSEDRFPAWQPHR